MKSEKRRYILGAGAMARETLQIYKDLNLADSVSSFIEENKEIEEKLIDNIIVHDSSVFESLPLDALFIGAIGSPLRKRWLEKIAKQGFAFDTVIHPSALISEDLTLGSGSILCRGVILTCDISIGKHTIINVGTTVSHDCRIGDYVTISPGVHVAGRVTLEDGCFLGIGATISNGITIGRDSLVGAGSVVIDDIPAGMIAYGVPAKPVKEIHECDWDLYI